MNRFSGGEWRPLAQRPPIFFERELLSENHFPSRSPGQKQSGRLKARPDTNLRGEGKMPSRQPAGRRRYSRFSAVYKAVSGVSRAYCAPSGAPIWLRNESGFSRWNRRLPLHYLACGWSWTICSSAPPPALPRPKPWSISDCVKGHPTSIPVKARPAAVFPSPTR